MWLHPNGYQPKYKRLSAEAKLIAPNHAFPAAHNIDTPMLPIYSYIGLRDKI